MMPIHYMILCHARTGSNYLVNLLAAHPAITAHNELFHETAIFHVGGVIREPGEVAKRDADPVAYLQHTLEQSKTPVCGFKHLLFNNQTVIDHVMQHDFHLILLKRENILAQYSSLAIAHQTGQWTLHASEEAAAPSRVKWHPEDFEQYRQQYVTTYRELGRRCEQRTAPILRLNYRDLFVPQWHGRVFDFLGVDPQQSDQRPGIRKQNTSDILDRFDQPAKVRDYLTRIGQTQWARESL